MPVFIKGERAILFVHVPRTGGSSITSFLGRCGWASHDVDPKSVYDASSPNYYRRVSPQHWDSERLTQIYRLERFEAIIQFVRHPLQRTASEYRWRRSAPDTAGRKTTLEFSAWWNQVCSEYAREPSVLDNHIRPQSDFLLPGAHIGFFGQDVNPSFFAKLGLCDIAPNTQNTFPQLNATDRTIWKEVLGQKGQIETFYAKDYENFGFDREADGA